MSENVITSDQVAPVKVPKSFNELNREQLVAAAVAFGADSEGTKNEIKADLLESGVTFDQYLTMFHPKSSGAEVAAQVEAEKFVMPDPVDIEDWPDAPEGGDNMDTLVTVNEVVALDPEMKYLIKFVGENPYFERGRFKFTREKPYASMTADDAQEALESEPTKFRQAFPKELKEYYAI